MAQSSKNRRGRTSRKPVTLDLEASEVSEAPAPTSEVPDAEPVAFDTVDASAAGAKDSPGASADADAAARGAVESGAGADKDAGSAPPSATLPKSRPDGRGFSVFAGGVAGGVVALLLAGGLQWAGVLPSPGASAPGDLASLQVEIDSLDENVAALQDRPAGAEAGGEVAATVEGAVAGIDENRQAVSALSARLGEFEERLSGLDDAFASVSAGDGTEPTAVADLRGRIDAMESSVASAVSQEAVADIEAAISGLREQIGALSGRLDGSLPALETSIADLRTSIGGLDQRLADVENDIDAGAGSRVASAIAASALKSAADRGASFMAELEAFAAVRADDESVKALREYAASGVPTISQLSERFPAVANRIVAAGSGVDPDAGVADRLMASARSLVQIRPVGEVEGEAPGAVAARMETALQRGDLERALAEWDTLPEEAKAVSSDFAADLRARKQIDTLISDVLGGAIRGSQAVSGQ
ncbi:mitofilin family membrane protein [Oricola cellulosilytica]|uniref:Phage tail protein n=1 Tax=Oricola cellulosilytica TaxID=1429082 RepID=A0A4R0PG92_9HYPH|nr:mitofilin family membrane protein [Oricola cellulosilytica]TCD15884.1 hypothetical protein E0D97_00120 [Oricola cellulosilytica]